MDQENNQGISSRGSNEPLRPDGGLHQSPVSSRESEESRAPDAQKGGMWGKWWLWVLIALIIAAGAYVFMTDASVDSILSGSQERGAVALVNGEPIERAEFNARFNQIELSLEAQGGATEEQLDLQREQLLDIMINSELMVQAATAEGLSVSEERIDSYYQNTVLANAESEEALLQQLSDRGFSLDDLREDIRVQILVQDYINAHAEEGELDVTEQESRNLYDQLAANQGDGENVPPYADVRAQIDQQLLQQKQNTIVARLVEDLREGAEIEKYL